MSLSGLCKAEYAVKFSCTCYPTLLASLSGRLHTKNFLDHRLLNNDASPPPPSWSPKTRIQCRKIRASWKPHKRNWKTDRSSDSQRLRSNGVEQNAKWTGAPSCWNQTLYRIPASRSCTINQSLDHIHITNVIKWIYKIKGYCHSGPDHDWGGMC